MAVSDRRSLRIRHRDNHYVPHYPSALHLARELVRADADAAGCAQECDWDHAQAWLDYRERLQEWRFHLVRGSDPTHLHVCPTCGGVQQLEPGPMLCFACGREFVGHE